MNRPWLVCFAVPQEAKPFQQLVRGRSDVAVLLTGIGPRNAERAITQALAQSAPAGVLTCGFAGALHAELKTGEVVFATPDAIGIHDVLARRGCRRIVFLSSARVVTTAREKARLRTGTGADAVEMESAAIARVCSAAGIPCATVRVISDAADEDLPLDFNELMTPEWELSRFRIALALLAAPQKIPALLRLGRNTARAAHGLARVLHAIMENVGPPAGLSARP